MHNWLLFSLNSISFPLTDPSILLSIVNFILHSRESVGFHANTKKNISMIFVFLLRAKYSLIVSSFNYRLFPIWQEGIRDCLLLKRKWLKWLSKRKQWSQSEASSKQLSNCLMQKSASNDCNTTTAERHACLVENATFKIKRYPFQDLKDNWAIY